MKPKTGLMKSRGWREALPFLLLTSFLLTSLPAQKLRQEERADYYQKWLNEDVLYIISDEERAIFRKLSTDEEKERFIEAFWKRRDPDPRTLENPFKEEHYRRIAYANERFSAGLAGWKTDRGKVYIKYGPPAQIDVNPTGTVLKDPRGGVIQSFGAKADLRGGVRPREIRTYPFEVWRYRYLEGIGTDVEIEFVDRTGSGMYTLAIDDEEKNVFAYKDPAADVLSPNRSDFYKPEKQRQFYRTELLANLDAPPPIKFNDLEQVVSSRIHYREIPFEATMSVLKVTDSSSYVPVSFVLPASNLDFRQGGDTMKASVNVFLQATNVQKRIVAVVEDTLKLQSASANLERLRGGNALYQKKLLLPPGRYVIDLVLKDNNSQKLGSLQKLLVVPDPGHRLSLSSLILADLMRPLGRDEQVTDPFAIGSHKIIPNIRRRFSQSKQAGLFFQIYGFSTDQASSKPDLDLRVTFRQGERVLLRLRDDLSGFGVLHGDRASVTISVPLDHFPPGQVTVEARVADRLSGRSTRAETDFTVVEEPS
ncbi:MAG: GWxTD domain-containing protein [Acidobacteriota bacterium]